MSAPQPSVAHDPGTGERVLVRFWASARAAAGVAELARAGLGIAEFSLAQPSLDEVFLALTGHLSEESDPTHEEHAS